MAAWGGSSVFGREGLPPGPIPLLTELRAAALMGVEAHMGHSGAGTAFLEHIPAGWCGNALPAVSFAFLCFHQPLPLGP